MPKEIVVVDNGSTDGSTEAIRKIFPDVHLLTNQKNEGICVGRNMGWNYVKKHFRFDYILFLDNDVILNPNFLTKLYLALENDKFSGLATGKAYNAYPTKTIMSCGMKVNLWTGVISDIGAYQKDVGQYDRRRYVDASAGCGCLVRAEVMNKTQGLDPCFSPYGWEDVDFSLRIRKCGYEILYVPNAIIYHSGTRQGRAPVPIYEENKAKNYILFIQKHATFFQKIIIIILFPFRWIIVMLKHIRQKHGYVALAHLRGLYGKFNLKR